MRKFLLEQFEVEDQSAHGESHESRYSDKCPNVALGVVGDNRVKILDTMGPHFEHCPEDVGLIEGEFRNDFVDGVYVYEFRFIRGDGWEIENDVVINSRKLTDEEWERWLEGDDPWPNDWYAEKIEAKIAELETSK